MSTTPAHEPDDFGDLIADDQARERFNATTAFINYEQNMFLTRYPCAICGGSTEKQDPMATVLLPSGNAGFACDECATADQTTIRERLIHQAEHLEKAAVERRAWAGFAWVLGTTEEQVRQRYPDQYPMPTCAHGYCDSTDGVDYTGLCRKHHDEWQDAHPNVIPF
jgi:hypothetical protein